MGAELKANRVPDPCGYHLVVVPIPIEEKTKGGIIKPVGAVEIESAASIVSCVLKVGPDAYKDKNKFPTGAWCKKGDFVITRSYAGTRVKILGHEVRIINDDSVEAVVEDPRGVERA